MGHNFFKNVTKFWPAIAYDISKENVVMQVWHNPRNKVHCCMFTTTLTFTTTAAYSASAVKSNFGNFGDINPLGTPLLREWKI